MHLLLIEDDLELGRALHAALKVEHFTTEWVRLAKDAPHTIDGARVDAVLLDLTLPDGSGMDLLRRWRRAGVKVPIIVITARSALDDRLAGLDNGADDFVIKPFETAELVSRIRAVVRRSARQASARWTVGALEIEPGRREAWLDGQALSLSPREFQLVMELAREPGSVVAKDVLSMRLEPLGEPVDFAAIEVHVSNLRKKIGAQRVRTVRGIGYLLEP
ncbi:response regulator transcription factor [Variovorax dokdonensis]|uniref:Response regulator transcription factor n=1 Tax=Variovorax dokdonensis TaxID=344883 RepID=A0ABT7N6S0_9BURK|nr:response regulator transcription factor [Variovorax dokdonensis]MDM0043632.1 response regulator transcription factor [Variovorax dokdonensis]